MDRNLALVVLAAAITFAACAWSPWAQKGRWCVIGRGDGAPVLVDSTSGRAWLLMNGRTTEVSPPENVR